MLKVQHVTNFGKVVNWKIGKPARRITERHHTQN